jgi:signal transduction histidine kinase
MDKKRSKLAPDARKRLSGQSGVHARADQLATRMEELSAQIDKARGYVSKAAHEILTPLTVAKGEIELALKQERSPDADRATFEVLLGQTQQLISLAMDILALATAGSSASRGAAEVVRLKDVVEDSVQLCVAASCVARPVEVKVEDVSLRGRTEDVARIVRNLVDNAIEHGPDGSSVRVHGRTRHVGGRKVVVLTVEDDGPGIPRELHERIFEPFFRGHRDRHRSGSGLGLAIARELARARGGDLSVDASHRHTRFSLVLPVQCDE